VMLKAQSVTPARKLGPAHALARRWAGLDQEAEQLRIEIARLRSRVSSAAYDLKAWARTGRAPVSFEP
jgi:hypothetical protein